VLQAVIAIHSSDTPENLAQRIHTQEHRIYPLAMRWFAEGRLQLGQTGVELDGQPLPANGQQLPN
jgi:phosphoribosylglycinamide formyltransferase-1